jgi:hypothetical protein
MSDNVQSDSTGLISGTVEHDGEGEPAQGNWVFFRQVEQLKLS